MIVYGHRSTPLEVKSWLSDLEMRLDMAPAAPAHDFIVELLVDIGEAESAVADALLPDEDEDSQALSGWRDMAGAIARAHVASLHGEPHEVSRSIGRLRAALDELPCTTLPLSIDARAAEGFACYGLSPDQYSNAARQLLDREHPAAVFCLGLRSVGSILAHVVAAELQRAGVLTTVRSVRPHGHPFDRNLRIANSMKRTILDEGTDLFAIVDEGPGLSGSSFAAAVDALVGLGIPPDRIVLVPSWDSSGERLNSERGRRVWGAHRRYVGTPRHPYARFEDLSAGAWRAKLFGGREQDWPAVNPQHEREKYLQHDPATLVKFAGLGKHGKRKLARAEALASEGFGAEPVKLEAGFLHCRWIKGHAWNAADVSAAALDRVAGYLAFVRGRFCLGTTDEVDELKWMMSTNASEAGVMFRSSELPAVRSEETERVAVDGRMLPYEWVVDSAARLMKVDGLDHHADDFFPGCRDIAWDIAGFIVECALPAGAAVYLVDSYASRTRDAGVVRRLPFYTAAYLSYRMGYASLSADSVAMPADAEKFQRLYADYRRQLDSERAEGATV